MMACVRSDGGGGGGSSDDDDDDDGCGGTAKSSGGRVHRPRQADWSVLSHGLCAAVIALTALRILPALAACLVGVCFLQPPVLRTLSSGLFRLLGLQGRRSSEANGSDVDTGRGCRPAPRKCLLAPPTNRGDGPPPPAPSTTSGHDVQQPRPSSANGRGTLPLVKRSLRLLMSVMRGVRRLVVVRPKLSRRRRQRRRRRSSSSPCRDTADRGAVTAVNTCNNVIARTVETVTGFRVNDEFVQCSQRQYLVCVTREHR